LYLEVFVLFSLQLVYPSMADPVLP
jgi:hypothetical protein